VSGPGRGRRARRVPGACDQTGAASATHLTRSQPSDHAIVRSGRRLTTRRYFHFEWWPICPCKADSGNHSTSGIRSRGQRQPVGTAGPLRTVADDAGMQGVDADRRELRREGSHHTGDRVVGRGDHRRTRVRTKLAEAAEQHDRDTRAKAVGQHADVGQRLLDGLGVGEINRQAAGSATDLGRRRLG